VEDPDEAIGWANALDFGPVCYLYTRDLRTSIEGAERLEFGTVNVNNVGGGDVGFPYSGWKPSGLGSSWAGRAWQNTCAPRTSGSRWGTADRGR